MAYAMEARILRPLLWFGLLEYRSENKNGFCAGCPSLTGVCCGDRDAVEEINLLRPWSQFTQILRHIAEAIQYDRVRKLANVRIACTLECHGPRIGRIP